jgi:hypothetical protein
MSRTALRATAILLASMIVPSSLLAQTSPASARPSEAGAHFERGATFYGEGDFAAALVEFKRAYEIDPAWQVLFDIGQSYFQLRDYANALTTLQRYAAEGGDRIGKEDRATLDSELPDLANRVARVTLESNVDGASVLVDDQAVGKTPLREPVLVSTGMRKITAMADGRAPVQRSIAVGGGDRVTVRLDFAAPAGAASAAKDILKPRPRTEAPSRVPAYVSFGLAGAGIATGAVFGVLTMQDKSRLDHACSASRACPPSSQPDIDAASRDGLASTIAFGAGAAFLALGVTLWLLEQPPRESAGVTLQAGPGGLTGSF